MSNIRSLVENKSKLDYKELTLSLVQEFGIKDKVEWDSVIPAQVQKELFGGETLRLFKDHETFANQKDIRAIHRSKGETSQLLILSAILNDEKLSKQTIERITKKFVGGQAAERYVVWFLGNPQHSAYKVVLSGKEGKKVVLKTLPFAVDQPYYKTYDFILNEVSSKVNKFFVEPNELWKSLWKAFDISVVNKQFYNDIKSSFNDLVENVLAKSFIKDLGVKKHFTIRLIGRLIFCWFLKKKGIVNDDVLSANAVGKYTNYYKELLEKLFFDVFNTPAKERTKNLPDEIKDYPFLNGGLFEDQKEDFKDNYQLYLPNEWFFNLFDYTLEKYNFTIDENTSSNAEIAIDPEMLGRIFENLLAEQNPETQESARKSTGSYYTPREIVDYMVEQSLIEYLKSNISKDVILNETKWSEESLSQKIEDFVHTEELPEELKPFSKEILDKLGTVKILDPACGSGAFPIGMLQKIIALKLQLSPLTKGGIQGGSKEVYNLKLQTILNSIYGCDIQPMAVELSRLRCWLSLIIDEPVDKKKSNWGIENLPNLDFKFVCVNTLISLPEFSASFGISEDEFNKLKSLREEYFTASAKRKEKIEEEFKIEQKKIAEKHAEWSTKNTEAVTMLTNWNPFDISETPWFDPFWMFGIKEGFDVVIGNPPYIQLQKESGKLSKMYEKQNFQSFKRTGDIYTLFYEKGNHILKLNGNLCLITSNKWMRAGYGEPLRRYLAEKTNPVLLIDFAGQKIFEAATVDTNILLYRKENYKTATQACIVKNGYKNNLTEYVSENASPTKFSPQTSWVILNSIEQRIKEKIERVGTPLKDWDINIYRGVLTGFNEAFIIDGKKKDELIAQDPKSVEIIRPILRGRDIKRYGYEFADLWLIATFPSKNYNIDDYPAVKQHLLSFGYNRLKQTGEIGARKKTNNKWFETQDSISYSEDFFRPKIIYPNMTKFLPFVYDEDCFLTNQKCFIVIGNNIAYLTAFFNSSLFKYSFRDNFPELQGGTRELSKIFFDKIPVKKIDANIEKIFRKLVLQIQTSKRQNKDSKQFEQQIDELIFDIYELIDEERQTIGFIEIV
ncbi:MAG: Eco57I restriction-modification methylase domain-containing protein [Bacteroidetes bacterium]|nr:Eco57I restriction-modification methylase domain-containing protein [Bacteroidota bacterium]